MDCFIDFPRRYFVAKLMAQDKFGNDYFGNFIRTIKDKIGGLDECVGIVMSCVGVFYLRFNDKKTCRELRRFMIDMNVMPMSKAALLKDAKKKLETAKGKSFVSVKSEMNSGKMTAPLEISRDSGIKVSHL